MGNEQKVIELQRDTVLADYKPLILHDDEIGTIYTDYTLTPLYQSKCKDHPIGVPLGCWYHTIPNPSLQSRVAGLRIHGTQAAS